MCHLGSNIEIITRNYYDHSCNNNMINNKSATKNKLNFPWKISYLLFIHSTHIFDKRYAGSKRPLVIRFQWHPIRIKANLIVYVTFVVLLASFFRKSAIDHVQFSSFDRFSAAMGEWFFESFSHTLAKFWGACPFECVLKFANRSNWDIYYIYNYYSASYPSKYTM